MMISDVVLPTLRTHINGIDGVANLVAPAFDTS